MFIPRPRQAEVLKYRSGKMGVAAVPGSGKTHTLSFLASELITSGVISDEQEVLIVTLVNSAVDNFSTRIAGFIESAGLLPNVGYRVRTLHGLAHDILHERPDLAGLSEQFSIVDESESSRMIDQITSAYLRENPQISADIIDPEIDLRKELKTQKDLNKMIADLNTNFIKQAKDFEIEPDELQQKLTKFNVSDPLMDMAVNVYFQYQRGLRYRGSLDFSDLIRLAYRAISSNDDFLERLRRRWPYILEDEAQDSSEVQEKILRRLVGDDGNWVRVGDTNQAIYETFTTASPKHLRSFLKEHDVVEKNLPNSGRSNLSIINLANNLNRWVQTSHPVQELREALSYPLIEPAPPRDPQPNPPDHPQAIFIKKSGSKSEDEVTKVVESIKGWLPQHMDKTVAVLCPIGWHAEKVVEALQDTDIEVVEMLKSTQSTRRVTRLLEKTLQSLADPSNSNKISQLFQLTAQELSDFKEFEKEFSSLAANLKKCTSLEEIFYQSGEADCVELLGLKEFPDLVQTHFASFREHLIRWQNATPLPIDRLILTIGQDLFTTPQDLALTHKLALLLEFGAKNHPEYQLTQFAIDLGEITSNSRKFDGFSEDDTGFNPEAHKGKVLVSTFHKAKGLEWDRVYLLSVNNYDFPSAQEFDSYKSEKWFIRNNLNIEAALFSKLEAIAKDNPLRISVDPEVTNWEARIEYAAERLRLLYVGITRARESLIITWNTGRRNEARMALPLEALTAYLENLHADS